MFLVPVAYGSYRVSVYLIAGFRKRVEEMSKWGLGAWRADVVSPVLLMVLNVQFGEGEGIPLVPLIRINMLEDHERMRLVLG